MRPANLDEAFLLERRSDAIRILLALVGLHQHNTKLNLIGVRVVEHRSLGALHVQAPKVDRGLAVPIEELGETGALYAANAVCQRPVALPPFNE